MSLLGLEENESTFATLPAEVDALPVGQTRHPVAEGRLLDAVAPCHPAGTRCVFPGAGGFHPLRVRPDDAADLCETGFQRLCEFHAIELAAGNRPAG